MPNVTVSSIQVKRKQSVTPPGSLTFGELALTDNGDGTGSLYAGLNDTSVVQVGGGSSTIAITSGEASAALVKGAPVYLTGSGTAKRAQANAAATAVCIGLVLSTSIAAAASGTAVNGGSLTATTGQWDAVTGQTGGLTPGGRYFVDYDNPGKLLAFPDFTTGEFATCVGVARSTTVMAVNISDPLGPY